ncbi:hypothetical protein [Rhizobium lentis]|nr:hypothetical protein [Rhizobium lentis]
MADRSGESAFIIPMPEKLLGAGKENAAIDEQAFHPTTEFFAYSSGV